MIAKDSGTGKSFIGLVRYLEHGKAESSTCARNRRSRKLVRLRGHTAILVTSPIGASGRRVPGSAPLREIFGLQLFKVLGMIF